MGKAFKTITLKLHKPGKYKKEVIDEALMNYSKAFQYLLLRAYEEIEEIKTKFADENGLYRTYNIKNWFKGEIDSKLNDFCIEPFKDSIKIDFSGVIVEYLNKYTSGGNVNFPMGYLSEDEFEDEFIKLINKLEMDESNDFSLDNFNLLAQRVKRQRPIYFCRYSKRRNFCLLYNPAEDKYYAKIYLMNVKNKKRKASLNSSEKQLIYISDDKEVLVERNRKNCYLLFPLEFGKYQEEFLREAIDKPEMLKTGRLYKKDNEYFISLNIEIEKTKSIKAINYMGISRSINSTLNYTIVDKHGVFVKNGNITALDNNFEDNELNRISREILLIAEENNCQLIMENLSKIGDKLGWVDKNGKTFYPQLNINKYNKLFKILNKKISHCGLPVVIRVSGVGIYYTCSNCNSFTEANRFSDNRLICINCGHTANVEEAGGINLARKLIKYSTDGVKFQIEGTNDGVKFINKQLEFEFFTQNINECIEEFNNEITKLVDNYKNTLGINLRNKEFIKKYGIIKKIEKNRDIIELIQLD